MDYLIRHYENHQEVFINDNYMMACLDACYTKLIKYFNKTDRVPVYHASIILDPSVKLYQFTEFRWQDVEIRRVKNAIMQFWRGEYNRSTGYPIHPEEPTIGPSSSNRFVTWRRGFRAAIDYTKDELERCLDEGRVDLAGRSSMSWWCDDAQRSRYPLLSRMAIDILSIPAMSSEAERLFSSAKNTITDKRNGLEADTVEALECLWSWLRAGFNVFPRTLSESFISDD